MGGRSSMFRCKQFVVHQEKCAMKVGLDSMLLGAWADTGNATHVLDIGTGTGLLALMMAQRLPEAQITAVDIHPSAVQQANENFERSRWAKRLTAVQANICHYHPPRSFDLIICNPPYFAVGVATSSRARDIARATHELTHEQLVQVVQKMLGRNGRFSLILPAKTSPTFQQLAQAQGLHMVCQTIVRPLPHKPPHRHLLAFAKQKRVCQKDELTIEVKHHQYTDPFVNMTKPFYLNL